MNDGIKIMIIAPWHQISDERVMRTVRCAHSLGKCYYAIDYAFDNRIPNRLENLGENDRNLIGIKTKLIFLPKRVQFRMISKYIAATQIGFLTRKISPRIVHIHECGRLGLLIAFAVRKLLPQSKIIFDYHDWIPYEVARSSCKNIATLYNLILPLSLWFYRHLARSVDTFICISPGHETWTRNILNASSAITMQNVRPKLNCIIDYNNKKYQPSLVVIGNIMRIRRLEFVVDVAEKLKNSSLQVKVDIFGLAREKAYYNELVNMVKNRQLHESFRFHGQYKDDLDIYDRISKGSVGIVRSWPENFDTGIQQIASANKFFSYLSLGVPAFVESNLDNMVNIIKKNNAGYSFDSIDDFITKAKKIWKNENLWDKMSHNALSIAEEMNSESYTVILDSVYRKLMNK